MASGGWEPQPGAVVEICQLLKMAQTSHTDVQRDIYEVRPSPPLPLLSPPPLPRPVLLPPSLLLPPVSYTLTLFLSFPFPPLLINPKTSKTNTNLTTNKPSSFLITNFFSSPSSPSSLSPPFPPSVVQNTDCVCDSVWRRMGRLKSSSAILCTFWLTWKAQGRTCVLRRGFC